MINPKSNRYIKLLIPTLTTVVLVVISIWIIVPLIQERNECISMGEQWLDLLKKHPDFSAHETGYNAEVQYHYANLKDDNLKRLREFYELDTIAGKGTEIEKIINLMVWVYRLAEHANEPAIPKERNAFAFIHMAKEEHKQINCYMKTVILNEVYLSMGFYSRHTHLLPYSNEENESHFITSVFPLTLGKWILMDPDLRRYTI